MVKIIIPSYITLLTPDSIKYNIKGSDDGVQHPELIGFWALSIVRNDSINFQEDWTLYYFHASKLNIYLFNSIGIVTHAIRTVSTLHHILQKQNMWSFRKYSTRQVNRSKLF
jgi:hypothetical protein